MQPAYSSRGAVTWWARAARERDEPMSAANPAEITCKVLVIGGGLAAASAARSAASFGDGVVLASKGPFGRSGASPRRATSVAQQIVGAEFAGNPAVVADSFVIDILEAGRYLNDQHL